MSLVWNETDAEHQGAFERKDEEPSDQESEEDEEQVEVLNYPVREMAHKEVNPRDYAISGNFLIDGKMCVVCETYLGDCYICPVSGMEKFDTQKCDNSYLENINRFFRTVTDVVCEVKGDRILYNGTWISTKAPFIDVGVIPIISKAPYLDEQIAQSLRVAFKSTHDLRLCILGEKERISQELRIENNSLVKNERDCRKRAMNDMLADETHLSKLHGESVEAKQIISLNLRKRRTAISHMTRQRMKFISHDVKCMTEQNQHLKTQIFIANEALTLAGKNGA